MLKVSAHRAAFRHFVPNKRFLGTQKSLTFHAPMLLFMCTHVFEPNLCTAPSTITTTNINDYLIARAYFVNRRDSKCMRFFFGWLCSWSNENRWARRVNALAFYVGFAFKWLFEKKSLLLSTHVHKSIASFLNPFDDADVSSAHRFSQTKSIFVKFNCFTRPFRRRRRCCREKNIKKSSTEKKNMW